jgi:subtilase family serine protease
MLIIALIGGLSALDGLSGWSVAPGAIDSSQPFSFTISVRQRNIDKLKTTALAVSTPGNEQYGKFLTTADIDALTAPAPSDIGLVTGYLRSTSSGVRFTVHNELIHVNTTVAAAEHVLQTSLYALKHKVYGTRVHANEPHLPVHVAVAVAAIFGLNSVPLPREPPLEDNAKDKDTPRRRLQSGPPPPPAARVTPAVLASTYSVGGVKVDRTGKNVQAVAEFQGQFMNKADLTKFFAEEVQSEQAGDDEVSRFVGTDYTPGGSIEAALDIQFIMGVAPGIKTEFWEWPDQDFCKDLLGYTGHMLNIDAPPLVNSISYGWQGDLTSVGCTNETVLAVDTNLAKLAAKGISIMISSGDSGSGYTKGCVAGLDYLDGVEITGPVKEHFGVPSANQCCLMQGMFGTNTTGWTYAPGGSHLGPGQSGTCTIYSSIESHTKVAGSNATSGGVPITGPPHESLWPSWPASSPWVTAVGATRFTNQQAGEEEVVCDQFGSGGGFSSMFSQDDAQYQVDAVAAYVAKGPTLPKWPPSGMFDPKGRATPDVAALGEGYDVWVGGHNHSVGGTSASSPAFAGLVSLINEARLQAGKPPL